MRISRNFIDELMVRVDIVDLIDSYISLRKVGRNYKALCPFHNEKTPSFSVNPDKQFYYCFGCGASGTSIGFLMNYARLSFVEAVHELASRAGMEVVYEQGLAPAAITAFDDLYEVMRQAAQYYKQQLRQSPTAISYLKKRGLTGEIARDFGIGYAPAGWQNLLKNLGGDAETEKRLIKTGLIKEHKSGRHYDCFRDRIMFPILDQRGRVIAFGGRILSKSEHEPKYLNSPETPLFQKSRQLYGWYFARQVRPLQSIIIVEGYMDVVALAQYGIHNAVASLGTATTGEHLKLLFRSISDIIFGFDGDKAGLKAAWRALETALPFLQGGRQVRFILLPQGSDPDSLVREEGTQAFNNRLTQAIPLSKFLFDSLMQQVDMKSLDGRARLVELAKPFLKKLPTGPYRDLMLQELSDLTHVDLKKLTILIQSEIPQQAVIKPKPFRRFVESVKDLSPVHRAIVYLLHKPALSQLVDYPNNKLSTINKQNIKLLLNLIEFTRMNPKLTLGAICEHWRGTDDEQIINQLASLLTENNDDINIDDNFRGAIDQLYKCDESQRWAELIEKGLEKKLDGSNITDN
jgi:DNA primase